MPRAAGIVGDGLGGRVREHALAVRGGRERDTARRPARRVHRSSAWAHTWRVQLFQEVVARTTQLDHAGQPSYLRSNFQRGVKSLPLSWTR
jgi:hypothetical protein